MGLTNVAKHPDASVLAFIIITFSQTASILVVYGLDNMCFGKRLMFHRRKRETISRRSITTLKRSEEYWLLCVFDGSYYDA